MRVDHRSLACSCGEAVFRVRANAVEAVGLATCAAGHHALLLDSRDVWSDAIQDGRPKELRCRCKNRTFALSIAYAFRDDSQAVRAATVTARCATCGAERPVFEAEIDYEPTDALLERPLDAIADPWRKARRVEVTALWKPPDLARLVRFVGATSGARLHFAGWRELPRELDAESAIRAVKADPSYDLFFTNVPVDFSRGGHDLWRRLPVVHVGSPMQVVYETGPADLYYVTYALEDIVEGSVVARPASFLEFAANLRAWLLAEFVSHRGRDCADNPSEYDRLKGAF